MLSVKEFGNLKEDVVIVVFFHSQQVKSSVNHSVELIQKYMFICKGVRENTGAYFEYVHRYTIVAFPVA